MAEKKDPLDVKGPAGCLTIILLCGMWLYGKCSSDKTTNTDPQGRTPEKIAEDEQKAARAQKEAAAPAHELPEPQPPKTCSISIPKYDGTVLVFPNEASYEEFGTASATKDKTAIDMASRAGYWVRKGTKCLWLHHGLLTSQVRILEGAHAGQIGWMDREWSEGAE